MKKLALNKDQYSESSKRSVGFEYLGAFYSDILYKCSKCYKEAIFSAEDQKHTYEVEKKYMWSKRTLCSSCWSQYSEIKLQLLGIESYYAEHKEAVLKDREYLESWLLLLKEYIKFGKKGNSAKIAFIEKALLNT